MHQTWRPSRKACRLTKAKPNDVNFDFIIIIIIIIIIITSETAEQYYNY